MRRRRACAPVLVLVTIIIPKDNIFLKLHWHRQLAVLCRMTEKEQADVVLSRKAFFVRCCLNCKKASRKNGKLFVMWFSENRDTNQFASVSFFAGKA